MQPTVIAEFYAQAHVLNGTPHIINTASVTADTQTLTVPAETLFIRFKVVGNQVGGDRPLVENTDYFIRGGKVDLDSVSDPSFIATMSHEDLANGNTPVLTVDNGKMVPVENKPKAANGRNIGNFVTVNHVGRVPEAVRELFKLEMA